MNAWKWGGIGLVLLLVLVPIGGFAVLLFPPGFMYDHYSTYSYTTSITTNGTVENATVSLPFPAGEDVAPDLDSTLWIYDDEGNRLTDWNPRIADTAHGPMLRLEPGRLVGEDRYILWTHSENGSPVDRRTIGPDQIPENMTNRRLIPDPTSYSISWQVPVDHDIETRYPIGNASFLAPATDMRAADCRHGWADEEVACSNFTTMTRATYEAEGSAVLTVGEIRFTGTNEWGFWLSNSYNTFETTISPQSSTDGRHGWTAVDGHLHAGEGRYDGPKR
ncbi:MAG: hypothetical protein ACI9PP_001227 [Halobacteriales archaeon]|jgi:hypothetical protein